MKHNIDEIINDARNDIKCGFPIDAENVALLCDAIDGLIPSLDRLQERLEAGATIVCQDGVWSLFDATGGAITSEGSVRSMLINLFFVDR